MIFFFSEKLFLQKLFSQNVFWIVVEVENIKKSFSRLKEGEKSKNFDKEVNSLTMYKIGGTSTSSISGRRTFFFCSLFFCQPNSELRSNHIFHILRSHSFVIFNGADRAVEVGDRRTSSFAKLFKFNDFFEIC